MNLNVKIPGPVDSFTLSASIGANGGPKTDVSVKPSAALAWNRMAKGNLPADICVCDPKLPGWRRRPR